MNKWILIAVGVLVVGGVGAWVVLKGGAGSSMPTPTQAQSGGMSQLMAQGTSKCEVTSETNGVTSSGTVYVANGKVHGHFSSTGAQTGTTESNMIVRDGFVYVWSSAMPQGIKMSADASAGAQTGSSQPNPYDANYTYTCSSWQADDAEFALPSNITFTEFSAAASGAAGTSGGSCAQCDMAPAGSAREQCRAALNCN